MEWKSVTIRMSVTVTVTWNSSAAPWPVHPLHQRVLAALLPAIDVHELFNRKPKACECLALPMTLTHRRLRLWAKRGETRTCTCRSEPNRNAADTCICRSKAYWNAIDTCICRFKADRNSADTCFFYFQANRNAADTCICRFRANRNAADMCICHSQPDWKSADTCFYHSKAYRNTADTYFCYFQADQNAADRCICGVKSSQTLDAPIVCDATGRGASQWPDLLCADDDDPHQPGGRGASQRPDLLCMRAASRPIRRQVLPV